MMSSGRSRILAGAARWTGGGLPWSAPDETHTDMRGLARGPSLPVWYHSGMSKQIAVRLSDDLVAFVDDVVRSGQERSRAAVVTRALERERRRMIAARDVEILSQTGADPELDGLAVHAAGFAVDD